jgi:Na+-translocating ferredoxin:NAD+ oxidoreductase RnfD subunit
MPWRFWLIDIPATIVDLWFFAYRMLLTVLTMACVSVVFIELGIQLVRWLLS